MPNEPVAPPLPRRPARRRGAVALASAALLVAALGAAGCTGPDTLGTDDDRVRVVTTTGLLADLVRRVGGDRTDVASLVPDGADPHSYEPSLRDVRNVVYADVAFSNYMLLEQQSIVRALDANLGDDVPNIALAEGAVQYAAEVIPLVEDVTLDTVWLGLRVRGTGAEHGADRSSEVTLRATGVDGPGDLAAYLTGSFGDLEYHVDSTDGFDRSVESGPDGEGGDTSTLPPDAHTHMSWAFTEPGIYRLELHASLRTDETSPPLDVGDGRITFAVGVDPHRVPGMVVEQVVDHGHADITVDLDERGLRVVWDPDGASSTRQVLDPTTAVIAVPNTALHELPSDDGLRRLGRPGDAIHLLPQAVLGRHVHGEIDPHLWHDVRNAVAYVELIRDTLVDADPAGATTYRRNAARYVAELERLDDEVRSTIADIPLSRRHLVTTHDAFGYLAAAYDVEISGFVTPNPATEPSLADRRRLARTIRNLDVGAVFVEPNLASRASTLVEVANELDVQVCPLLGDTFVDPVDSYVEMMRTNANSLRDCLAR